MEAATSSLFSGPQLPQLESVLYAKLLSSTVMAGDNFWNNNYKSNVRKVKYLYVCTWWFSIPSAEDAALRM